MRLAPALLLILAACDSGPSFSEEINGPILMTSCALSTCHLPGEDGAEESGLVFDPDQPGASYGALVDAKASLGLTLVVPGDSAASFLVTKIMAEQDPATEGDPMPPPFGLDSASAALIVDWIDAGAKDN